MRSKHQKKDYVLVDESSPSDSQDQAVDIPKKAAHARISTFSDSEEEKEDTEIGSEKVTPNKPQNLGKIAISVDETMPFEAFSVDDVVDDSDSGDAHDAPDTENDLEEGDVAENIGSADFESSSFFAPEDSEIPVTSKSNRGLKIAGIVAGAVVGVAAVAYVAGALFFGSHFLPGTTINGIDVSCKTPEEVQPQIASQLESYQLEVSGYGYEQVISGESISYGMDYDQDLLANASQWTWPVDIIKGESTEANLQVVYDMEALEGILGEAVAAHNEGASSSADAYLAYDEASDAIVVASEVWGTALDPKQVSHEVEQALSQADSYLELEQQDLIAPGLFSDDEGLNRAASQINDISNVNVTLTLGGYPAVIINRGNLLNWIITDDNRNVSLNEEAVHQWAEATAEKLDTYGTEHSYTRPDGKEVAVSCSEAFGWSVDTGALTETIVQAVQNGATGEIAIPCDHEGAYYNMETGAEWTRYIDIDLSEQHAYFFNEEGEILWESDIVSGNVNYYTRQTPVGVFSITRKATNERLSTYEEGKEEPNISYVSYWMPFIGNVYALHDAWWQSAFGGTRYRDGYGSHGCVNLPTDKAAELYDIIEVGEVVVVHW